MKKPPPVLKVALFLNIVLWILSCAAIGPPTGGEEDTTPPVLLSVSPENGTLRFRGGEIHMAFSEYIDENSVEQSIQVSPRIPNPLPFKYKGKDIFFQFPENLDTSQTYVLTLNRQLKDEHGVPLAKPIQLAFSTGDFIDRGMISGQIFGEGTYSIHLWNTPNSDSLFATEPYYITDSADDGSFHFQYLPSGDFTLLGVESRGVGMGLDPKRIAYGVTQDSTLRLDQDGHISDIRIRPWKESQPLQVTRGDWVGNRWGWVYFNRELNENFRLNRLWLNLKEKVNLSADYFLDPLDKTRILVTASDSLPGGKMTINIEDVLMKDSLMLDSTGISVRVPSGADTSYLEWGKPLAPATIQSDGKGGPPYSFVFSKPILSMNDSAFVFTQNDSEDVDVRFEWATPMHLNILPDSGWGEKIEYTLTISPDQIHPIEGKSFKDSMMVKKVNTLRELGYGGLKGTVMDSTHKPLIVVLNSVEKPHDSFREVVNSSFVFHYKHIPEGTYQILLFEDRDENQEYTFGKAYPFRPSEWFYYHPDTIEVRANWDIELSPIMIK